VNGNGRKEMQVTANTELENLRERMAKLLIDNLHVLGYSGFEAENLWRGKPLDSLDTKVSYVEMMKPLVDAMRGVTAPTDNVVSNVWECLNCGSQEYMSDYNPAQHDVGCKQCGRSNWREVVYNVNLNMR
jgi:hypothetical protein